MSYMPWCTGYYKRDFCKKKISELRALGKYEDVKFGGSVKENGIRYYRILVKRKEEVKHEQI